MPSQATFEASGLFLDSGSAAVWTWYSNWFTAHSYPVLESAEGTLTIRSQRQVTWVSETVAFFDGRWVIHAGTGVYEDLYGAGAVHGEMDNSTWSTHFPIYWTWTDEGHFDWQRHGHLRRPLLARGAGRRRALARPDRARPETTALAA